MGREKMREEFTLLEQDFRQVTTQKLELLQVLTNKVGMPFIICIQCLRCIHLTSLNQCCMFFDYITVVDIMIFFSYHHHHWAAVVSRGWANASACCLQVSLFCPVLCQIMSFPYLSRSSLHRLAGLPCQLFLSYMNSLSLVIILPAMLPFFLKLAENSRWQHDTDRHII